MRDIYEIPEHILIISTLNKTNNKIDINLLYLLCEFIRDKNFLKAIHLIEILKYCLDSNYIKSEKVIINFSVPEHEILLRLNSIKKILIQQKDYHAITQ